MGIFIALAFIEFPTQLFLFMTPMEGLTKYMPVTGIISILGFQRLDNLELPRLVYYYALQLIFMVVIYNQYKQITWLRKR